MSNPAVIATHSVRADRWLEVRARDHVMRYRRWGTGPSVLLLAAADAPDPLWPELLEALGARFRLIVPELSPAEPDPTALLTAFLEGIGTTSAAVVAVDALCVAALELALRGGEQIGRLVLVPDGPVEDTGLEGALATVTSPAIPLLVVRRRLPAGEALPLVTGFLDGGDPPNA